MTLSENGSTSSEVAEGEVGELYLRGPNIFLGYHNNPTATAECLSPDGWFRTGDVGFQDRVGNFYVTDRAKELTKYNGFQVAPAELEGILIGHDWVEDAGVVGFQSKDMHTELPLAFVVATAACKACKQSEDEKARQIVRWVDARVAYHKRLRAGVHFVTAIPKNPSGKVLRRLLKEEARKLQRANANAKL
jgi:acyl-CoA synthetase (AMP-forming)/AMP-acid ligase II